MKRFISLLLLTFCLFQPILEAQHALYIGIEDVALTPAARETLIDGLKQLGRANDSPYPNLRNHWRIRPDGKAVILEAEFDDTTITAAAIKTRLVALFNVSASSVTYTTAQTVYGPTITFKQNSTVRLRMIAFGGVNATWAESRLAASAYIKACQADADPYNNWEPVEP